MAKLAGLENQARSNSHVGSNPTPSSIHVRIFHMKDVKKFLMPTINKFFIMAILFAITSAVSPLLYRYIVLDAKLVGLPMPYTLVGNTKDFFIANLLLDLAFWYIVASFLEYLNRVTRE